MDASPFETERLWDKMYRSTVRLLPQGRDRGRAQRHRYRLLGHQGQGAGSPCTPYLGGKTRDRGSVCQPPMRSKEINVLAAEAQGYVRQGLGETLKQRFGFGWDCRLYLSFHQPPQPDPDLFCLCPAYRAFTLCDLRKLGSGTRPPRPAIAKWISTLGSPRARRAFRRAKAAAIWGAKASSPFGLVAMGRTDQPLGATSGVERASSFMSKSE